jgi:transposase InsO family protein
MSAPVTQQSYRLGQHDRVKINGTVYRPIKKIGRVHVLQLVTSDLVMGDLFARLSDEQVDALRESKQLRIDPGYFSRAQRLLQARGDDSDLSDLSDDQLQTIAWKVEWCTRFECAYAGRDGTHPAPRRTPEDIEAFIEANKDKIHRWYVDTFKVSRPLGRAIAGEERKLFDYPGATTLRQWLKRFAEGGHSKRAFRPKYHLCGNRNQLDPRARTIVERRVSSYASLAKPEITEVYASVQSDIQLLNGRLSPESQVYVSERAVRRRVRKLTPMFLDLGRLGPDRTARKYSPVGDGLITLDGLTELSRMDRVEMDDWEMDLHVVVPHKHARDRLTAKGRRKLKQMRKDKETVRCTVTVGIDVVTKCIVALSVSPFAPSVVGSKSALRMIVADKSKLAAFAEAASDWPMCARPLEIATDAGPAFRGDFHESVIGLGIEHRFPAGGPTSRGTIEAFFRTFKRFCRKFTGQAFANVVEKGDYPAEQLASLLVEDLQKLLIRFIVDDYHHRPHRGLAGKRPYTAWHEAGNDLGPLPDHFQKMIAFGIPLQDRKISAAGVRYLHADYKHPKMGRLHSLVRGGSLTVIVDPHDMGTMLVRIPDEFKPEFPDDDGYLVFEAQGLHGTSVAEHVTDNSVLLKIEREENQAGLPFRLGAHRAMTAAAEQARKRANVPPDELPRQQYERFVRAIESHSARVVAARIVPSAEPMDGAGPDGLGRVIAVPQRARLARPDDAARAAGSPMSSLARSINRYDEEDEA